MCKRFIGGNTCKRKRKGSLEVVERIVRSQCSVKKEERKKKKIKLIKSEVEDLAEPLSGPEGLPPLSQAPSPLAIPAIKEE